MLEISARDYFRTSRDYKGIYEDFYNENPEWKGRKTLLTNSGFKIEGVNLKIVGHYTPTNYEKSQLHKA